MSNLIKLYSLKIFAELNLAADHWQFYHIDGRDEAAERLNRDVEQHLATHGPKDIGQVLKPYSKWGATDSEGYNALAWILDELGLDSDCYI